MDIKEIVNMIEKGLIEEALQYLDVLEDIEKVIVLAKASMVTGNFELIDDALYILEKSIKKPDDKIIGYSEIAMALAKMGDYESSTEYFNKAIELLNKLDQYSAAVSAMLIGNRLAKAGFYDSAFETFEYSFDQIIDLDIEVSRKTDLILSLADIIEKTGDELPSDIALKFYERAYDIFDKLKVGQRAGVLEKKIRLAKIFSLTRDPEIRKLSYEGRFKQAIYKAHERFSRDKRGIVLLEMTLWAKENNMPIKHELLEMALKELENSNTEDKDMKRAVEILTELDEFQKAIEFAEKIRDPKVRDEALAKIAEKLAELGEVKAVREIIIPRIESEEVKRRLFSKL
ncbi:hypothetical protein A3L04_10445 [Thermococcus chitonophagus]|nr:hypothetical protein [Thermococcus chitonophagus]ASJ17458.1 hypothetical protein A3L04_10445 [Thermococcus chitonophagus]